MSKVIPNRGNTTFILIQVKTNMIPAMGRYNWRSKLLENIGDYLQQISEAHPEVVVPAVELVFERDGINTAVETVPLNVALNWNGEV